MMKIRIAELGHEYKTGNAIICRALDQAPATWYIMHGIHSVYGFFFVPCRTVPVRHDDREPGHGGIRDAVWGGSRSFREPADRWITQYNRPWNRRIRIHLLFPRRNTGSPHPASPTRPRVVGIGGAPIKYSRYRRRWGRCVSCRSEIRTVGPSPGGG